MTTNPLLLCAEWLAETNDLWPEEAKQTAHHAFIDTVGVSLPGAGEAPTRAIFDTVKGWGNGPCAAIGTGMRLPAPHAALVNGTAAHALDFDDNFDPAKTHASAVLVPAIMALAEQQAASGEACIDAYIAGLQVLGCVGEGINPRHRQLGWHATGTVGAVGAAAACARLLKLDTARAAHAISLSTSMAGGFMSQFGTMAKPVHAGLAAQAGIVATSMARSGIKASADTLHGPYSMRTLMAQLGEDDPGPPTFRTERIGDPLLIVSMGLKTKRFPNCGSAHRAMDGLSDLIAEHRIAAPDVERISVSAPCDHLENLMYTAPETPAQAKFSMEHALACILVDGTCKLSHFRPDAVMRPDLRAVYAKVKRIDLPVGPEDQETIVHVQLTGGQECEARVPWPAGSKARPFTAGYFREKFNGCAEAAVEQQRSEAILDALERLPGLRSLAELTGELVEPLDG